MSTKIGHFEILSELSKSTTATVYKANDPQGGQTVALKAIQLSAFGESAADLEAALLTEAEATKSLSCPNIVLVLGAGEIEGQFCATMEYVQGNSISTMLARKEGFSIWDLLDIGRQVCSGLDHAHSSQVFHYSLEPAKIMCGWDGTVKVLGFGVSSAGKFAPQTPGLPSFLHYMSPEQVCGEPIDRRSNLFSLGAMFYEMLTERLAFDGQDRDSVFQSIVESTPASPAQLNPKIHPLLNSLIMRALDKDPAQRYHNGRELLDELEKCKESKTLAAKKPAQAATPPASPGAAKVSAQSKFVISPVAPKTPQPIAAPASKPPLAAKTPVTTAAEKPMASPVSAGVGASSRPMEARSAPNKMDPPAARAVAAATGFGGGNNAAVPEPDASSQFITSCVKATLEASEKPSAYLSAAVADQPVETFAATAPKIAVDPMMVEGAAGCGSTTSFSEISELPPLKEIYVEPPPPPPIFDLEPTVGPSATVYREASESEEKPKIQPREVAEKAIKEIRNVPPRLMLYAVAGAIALILMIGIALAIHIHNLNSEDDSGAARPTAATEAPPSVQPQPSAPEARNQPAPAPVTDSSQLPAEPEHAVTARSAAGARGRGAKKKAVAPPAPVVLPGGMALDSTPQGAQVQVDGRTDPAWVTPLTLSGLTPGQHTVTVSKPGYSTDTRSVEVTSGSKSSIVLHLAQLVATLSVSSDPAGANIYVDGRDVGKSTPAQVSVDKGQHIVLVRKMGYLDETATAQFVLGQTVSLSPTLRPLGNGDSIKTVGKMKKLFGGSGVQAGQVIVSVKTQPKGAQVTINQHMLEKGTPVEVALDPGNYVVDITLSGYAPIHKVISADKGSKLVVDEILQRQ